MHVSPKFWVEDSVPRFWVKGYISVGIRYREKCHQNLFGWVIYDNLSKSPAMVSSFGPRRDTGLKALQCLQKFNPVCPETRNPS